MPLTSLWFSSNARLQQCLEFDPSHVKRGDQGEHVLLIQEALSMLDNASIDLGERSSQLYGRSTAAATLAFKRKRNIINSAYESKADDIVGKMTIRSLDDAMRTKESIQFRLAGAGGSVLRGLLFAPTVSRAGKGVVVTETNAPFFAWAKTFAKTFAPIGTGLVPIPNRASVAFTTAELKKAATIAGAGGFIVLSVGHGSSGASGFADEGFFDLAPGHSFQVAGQNAFLVGDPPPASGGRPSQVSAFYDFRQPNPILKGGFAPSRKDNDLAQTSSAAKQRLSNFAHYEDIGRTFSGVGLSGVIILSCRVGAASGFMKRVRQQWGVPIIGYPRRVVGQDQGNGRTRIFLQGDAPGSGTNIPFGEFLFPLSPDMVVF